jgi:hypothetical protein
MMEISAPPVVSREYSAYDRAVDARHETQSRIPSQIPDDTLPGIAVAVQADPWNATPQGHHGVVIPKSHSPNRVFHLLLKNLPSPLFFKER